MNAKAIVYATVFLLVVSLAVAGLLREEQQTAAGGPVAEKETLITESLPIPSTATQSVTPENEFLTLSDSQGAVTVAVTPVRLDEAGDVLLFEIAMNTHSVDLSMDLAKLATLSTDTGMRVQPLSWDAIKGGHHVSGLLSFPSSVDGKSVLSGTTQITLTITGVDADSRVFTWNR